MNIGNFSPSYQIFYDFLRSNNALEAFVSQCNSSDKDTTRPIDHGLHWSSMKEGYTYWSNLHNKAPRGRIRITDFISYCKLHNADTLQTPYEFW